MKYYEILDEKGSLGIVPGFNDFKIKKYIKRLPEDLGVWYREVDEEEAVEVETRARIRYQRELENLFFILTGQNN